MRSPSAVLRALAAALAVVLALAAVRAGERGSRGETAGSPIASAGVRLELAPALEVSGFSRVQKARPFTLPADHGPHFEYQTEWWYVTGNLVAADGGRFGFQLTFFRRGLSPGPPPAGPGLSTNQVYFAHLALTDVGAGRHLAAERFERGAGGLAGASAEPFRVWLEDWRLEDGGAPGGWRLSAADPATGLLVDLRLRPQKPLVAHGDRGVSAKGEEPGNASYYVGYTRIAASGRVGVGDQQRSAAGEAWFDHEWSTSALGGGDVGWDWFSLQLGDGRELMCYRIRRADGSCEPVSAGTLVDGDGRARRLARDEVRIEALRRWKSAATGVSYPSGWRVEVPSAGLRLRVEPWLEDQEMRTSFVYWEGAVRVQGEGREGAGEGQGYVELTGYARSMEGVL
ncbi:MAG TPA: lipocalin-like domain-containing protein [Vicinamibacteria bacterium]|nr:lipocalin-like domain-containing protein [Vicinamibacteria bacterium]